MRVSLIKYGKIYNTILPSKIEGSFWIEDKDFNNQRRNLINIEAKNNKWELKSNYETKILFNNNYVDSINLEKYMFYELKVLGEDYNYIVYCSDVYDENSMFLRNKHNSTISIGNGIDNTINYNNKYIATKQCIIEYNNSMWKIKNLTNNAVVFVNSVAILETELKNGDVIFLMGLKIIFFNDYIIMNNHKDIIDYNKNILEKFNMDYQVDESKIENMDDTEIKVYNKHDYYYRIPRFKTNIKEENITLDAPPQQENDEEMPLIYTLGPMMTMGISSLVTGVTALANVLSGMQTLRSSMPTLITSVAMLLTMVLWPLLQKKYSKKQKKKRETRRVEQYKKYIKKKSAYIQNQLNQEKQILFENNKSLEECNKTILNKTRNLWERKIEHEDFLDLRLGIGNIRSYLTVNYPEEHFSIIENNLREELENLAKSSEIIEQVPVTINFTEKYISAILLRDEYFNQFFYGLMLRILSYHSYEDLKIVILTNSDYKYKWDKFKNIPYCFSEKKDIRFFSDNLDNANQISMYLDSIFKERATLDNKKKYIETPPYYLIISDDYQSISNLEIIKDILNSKENYGFSLIMLQDRLLGLPNECQAFINIDPLESGIFENELSKENQQIFKPDFLGEINIKEIIKKISNIPIDKEFSSYTLPDKYGFLEMYNVGKVEQLNIHNRWQVNNPIISLQAPIGVDSNGEILKLDLHEKVHGPHGLIAGMTGSGKSEFIITYILSMAINYNPDEVAFVLIDYKGGGLTGAFENKETGIILPHLAGTITNLDVNDMNRALASIESELKRRQKIFREARESVDESTIDIYKYQKLRREGKVTEPVPHLFIICDEFAELKVQQPDFMDELISTARIGRSLGVHLILATQKPSGIVNDQILSNTRFRVCLKVQDKNDSMDMIKRPDAAMIQTVGRFFLQVGYNELFSLAQSAYAGVPYKNTDKIKKKLDTNISFIDNVGNVLKTINNSEEKVNVVDYGDELLNIVKYLFNISKEEGIRAKKLWLDKIPAKIYVDELKNKYNYIAEKYILNPIIGEYDDPNSQSQNLLTLPLSTEGNTIIYGTAGSGKEQMLTSIIYSLATTHSSDEVNIYILDYGSESLKSFMNFPHVGDVLLLNDNEKLQNLIKKIRGELALRKRILSNYGGSYIDYCRKTANPLPNIVIVINLYEALSENDFELQDTFNELTRDCSKYGITFILSTTGTNTIRYKLKQNFKQNIILQLANEVDYLSLIGNTHGKFPSKIKGRGLIKLNDIYEFQTASITREDNQQEYLLKLGKILSAKYNSKALKIPSLPDKVTLETVSNEIKGLKNLPVGIEKSTLEISTIDIKLKPINIVYSESIINMKNFIEGIINVSNSNKNISVNILDAENILNQKIYNQNFYQNNFDNIVNELFDYSNKLYNVYQKNNYNVSSISTSQEVIVIIIGISSLLNQLNKNNQEVMEKLFNNIKKLQKIGIIIFDSVVNIKKFEFKPWFVDNSLSSNGIWVGNNISNQFLLKISKMTKELREEIGNNFGYNVKNGTPSLIKLIQLDDSKESEG